MAISQTLRGLTTICYYALDHEAAKKWYAELLGIPPYFERPGYAEFRIGDYQHELGLIDGRYAPEGWTPGVPAPVTYWHVDEINESLDKLISLGATLHEPVTERGPGFITASVIDPFGNILGIMYNVHYLEVLNAKKS